MAIERTTAPEIVATQDTEKQFLSLWQRYNENTDEHDLSDVLLDMIATRFRLLGDPLRLKILAALASGERNVGDLVALTGAGQANISKHLAALAQGGLLRRRKAGTSIYYTISDTTVLTVCDAVCASLRQRYAAQAKELGFDAR